MLLQPLFYFLTTTLKGRISDIGLFFVHIETSDNKQIPIPSNLFIQKAIKKDLPNLNND